MKDYLLADETGLLIAFADEVFQSENELFPQAVEMVQNYVNYIADNYGNDNIVELLKNFDRFEEIVGMSEAQMRLKWIQIIELEGEISEGGLLIISDTSSDLEFAEEFPRAVLAPIGKYYFDEANADLALETAVKTENSLYYLRLFFMQNKMEFSLEGIKPFFIGESLSSFDDTGIFLDPSTKDGNNMSFLIEVLSLSSSDKRLTAGLAGYLQSVYGAENSSSQDGEISEDISAMPFKDASEALSLPETLEKEKILANFVGFIADTYGESAFGGIYSDPIASYGNVHETVDMMEIKWLASLGKEKLFTPANPAYTGGNYSKSSILDSDFSSVGSGNIFENEDVSISFPKDYLTPDEEKEAVSNILNALDGIKNYLGTEYTHDTKLEFIVKVGENSLATGNIIEIAGLKEGDAEYAHEAVHVLGGEYYPLWIGEGFATLLDQKFSPTYSTPAGGQSLHELAKTILLEENHESLLEFSDNDYRYARFSNGQNLKPRAYIIAASLLSYVEKTYGKEKLFAYHSDSENIESILGLSFAELLEDWLSFLEKE